jgi:hypothetical protein
MALNPDQFVTSTPDKERSGVPLAKWKSTGTISASDALHLVTAEHPRIFTTGDLKRTDWKERERGETSLDDFVQYRHSPRTFGIKYQRAKWGEPDSLYRHIQKHGLDRSNAIYVMKHPLNPKQVFLTEGHHRVAAAHAIDPDMPLHYIDEGEHMSHSDTMNRLDAYHTNLRQTENDLTEYFKNPTKVNAAPKDSDSYDLKRVRRTAFEFSMDAANIKPSSPNSYGWRDYNLHKD